MGAVFSLVERDGELLELDGLLERAAEGEGGALTVGGAAGIGKTELLGRIARSARARGFTVLTALGSELEATFAFGTARQLLERHLRQLEPAARAALLSGVTAPAALLLDPGTTERPAAGEQDVSFGVFHGLYWLVANLAADRPLLLAVDDLQWCDVASVQFLAYLTRRLNGLPVALAGALRSKSRPTDRLALDDLLDAVGSAPLKLAPLTAAGVASVVRDHFAREPDQAFSDACHEATGGNPLFLRELLRSGVEPGEKTAATIETVGPMAVAELVLRRTGRAGPEARPLAEALAVLGDHSDIRRVARLTGLDSDSAAQGLRRLADSEVLVAEDPPMFIHPLVRAAIYEALPVAERDRLHRMAAELLADEHAASDAIAAHLERCRPRGDAWTIERLTEAAADAIAKGAPAAGVGFLRRALEEPPSHQARPDVLRSLAKAENLINDFAAIDHLEEAWELTPDGRQRAEIALELGSILAWAQRGVDAVRALERGLRTLDGADALLAERLDAQIIAEGLTHGETAELAQDRLSRYGEAAPVGPAALSVLAARGMATFFYGGTSADAADLFEQALATGSVTGPDRDSETHAGCWLLLTYAERPEAAKRALLAEREVVQRTGRTRDISNIELMLGFAALRSGNLPEALSRAQASLALNDSNGAEFARSVIALVAIEWGDLDEADRVLTALPATAWETEAKGDFLARDARGRLHLARGRLAEARVDFEYLREKSGVWGSVGPATYEYRTGLALVCAREGELAEARRLAEEELEEARVFDGPRAIGCALRTLGLVTGGEEGIESLQESVMVLDGSYAKLEHARSLVELGAALRRTNRRAEARQPLADGLDLAYRCGARALVQRAREELQAAGSRPRRIMRTGVESLTPCELRVVRMAAAGASNRDIAQELYITPKTVEGHLGHAYLKLDLSGREARGRLGTILAGELAV